MDPKLNPEIEKNDLTQSIISPNDIINNLIDVGFDRIDIKNRGYVTKEDIQSKYNLSDKHINIIIKPFEKYSKRKNRITKNQFKIVFKKLIELLY